MKAFLLDFSLRARLALVMSSVILPFLLAAGAGALYLLPRLTGPMEAAVKEVSTELLPLMRLRAGLLEARGTVKYNFMRTGPDVAQQLLKPIAHVEQLFEHTLAAPFEGAEELGMIRSAHREWQHARRLAETVAQLGGASKHPHAEEHADRVDAHVRAALAFLDHVLDVGLKEIEDDLIAARAGARDAVLVTLAAFSAALAMALVAGPAIMHPAIAAVGALRRAAARMAAGDLAARVVPHGRDEIGELGLAFNAMAEEIERDRTALAELAVRDALTGLANRREFDRRLAAELERARRYRHPLTVLLLDLDHFKAVNDSYGHPAGDEALRVTAARIRTGLRPMDCAARYGGEEFAVILPETAAGGALAAAERIRAAVAGAVIPIPAAQALQLTLSIGVAEFPQDAQAQAQLLAAADEALYSAKRSGRNRVCHQPRPADALSQRP